ncbi:D-2-hydroxyacid dehydrogenase [Bacillus marinisedimentorum]|uniref:D-2-hydroxyacid dehydrogenase n=1 Tax=Bacillus marinisedimentorum TaxID=1821260 RepID=UPI0007DFC6B3|nr:D-2-hydroxyacid dehydrogenase [Bacillus marinisedimentorum]
MFILCTARVNGEIRETTRKRHPDLKFSFQRRMNEEALKELPEAEVLLTYGEDLDEGKIAAAKKLKWIMVLSAGLDKMPFAAIKERNILVTNARGIHKTPMAEYTIGMMLQTARKTKTLIAHEKEKKWDRTVKMSELSEKTLVIAGAGAIGSEIARLARAFGMKTIGVSRSGREAADIDVMYKSADLKKAAAQGDYVVSVLPSTPDTKKMFGRDVFHSMKRDAVFINIGRGDTVNEKELIEVMKGNVISHAVLDVFEQEPLPESHPFWEMGNVTVTPHLSGISPEYHFRAFKIFEQNLAVYQTGEGEYMNVIDPDRGY